MVSGLLQLEPRPSGLWCHQIADWALPGLNLPMRFPWGDHVTQGSQWNLQALDAAAVFSGEWSMIYAKKKKGILHVTGKEEHTSVKSGTQKLRNARTNIACATSMYYLEVMNLYTVSIFDHMLCFSYGIHRF